MGVWAISTIGTDPARAAISVFILIMCFVLWRGFRFTVQPGAAAHTGIGVVSGLANGAAVGGLPVAAFFAAQTIPAAAFRATTIAYFTALDLWTLPNMLLAGMFSAQTVVATAWALPFMLAGLALGSRRFHATSPAEFRRFAILLLAVLSVLGLLRAAL